MPFDSTGVAKRRVGAIMASSALVSASLFTGLGTANAAPAADAAPTSFGQAAGEQLVTVPDGVCAVNVTIGGGRGGVAVGEGTPDPEAPEAPEVPGEETGFEGSGARISATLNVQAGTAIELSVGGDGSNAGIGGFNGGGDGGVGGHRGGGGGGYTTISVGGDLLLLAGGGGGTGGGHQAGEGSGGDAGFGSSTLPGVAVEGGTAYPGSKGGDGWDVEKDGVRVIPTGGGGGTEVAGGAGGTSTLSSEAHSYDGESGAARQGGNGGNDGNLDTAGGGGGGLFGGGGGASTQGAGAFTGSGGGGGSSFIADSSLISSPAIENNRAMDEEGHAGRAEPAFASFEWVMCDYNLSIEKKVVGNPVYEEGSTVRYAVTVTNDGPDVMAIGDTVTLIDDLAVGGTLVSVDGLDSSIPAAGETITGTGIELFDTVVLQPAETDDEGNETAPAQTAKRGLVVGDSVTVTYDVVITGSTGEPITNTVSVADRNGTHEADAVVDPAKPSLSLTKSADTERATAAGQKITYSFVVTNTGNIDLKDIAVAEGSFSGKGDLPTPSCPAATLEPSESMTCTSVYTVVAEDLTGKDLTNTATATGKTPLGAPVASEESSAAVTTVVPVVPAPLAMTGGGNQLLLAGAALLLLALGGTGIALARRRAAAAK